MDSLTHLNCYIFADSDHIKKEKQKVKDAKKSRWWQQKASSGLCYYCKEKFKFHELTLDHIVPLSRGGRTVPGNVVPSCRPCNQKKGVNTPVDQVFDNTSI